MKKRIAALVLAFALAMGLTGGMVFAADEDTYDEIAVGEEYTITVDDDDFAEVEDGDSCYIEGTLIFTSEESGAYTITLSGVEDYGEISIWNSEYEFYYNWGAAFGYSDNTYSDSAAINTWIEAGTEYCIGYAVTASGTQEFTVCVEQYDGVVIAGAEYVSASGYCYVYEPETDDLLMETGWDTSDFIPYSDYYDGFYCYLDYVAGFSGSSEDMIILTYSDGTAETFYCDDEKEGYGFVSADGETEYYCNYAMSEIYDELLNSGDTINICASYYNTEAASGLDYFSLWITLTVVIRNDADEDTAVSDDSSSDDDSDGTSSGTDDSGSADDSDSSDDSGSSLSVIDSETTASYTLGSGGGAVIAVDADIADFISVTVDGTVLAQDTDYTVTEGSTIITFTESFLESLSEGDHDVVIAFEDGDVETTLTIAAAASSDSDDSTSPETGDCANLAFWTALALLSAFGLAVSVLRRRFS